VLPHDFELVRQLGATYLVDRAAPDAVEDVRKYSQRKLTVAFDNATNKETTEKCCATLATDGSEVLDTSGLPVVTTVPPNIRYNEIFIPTVLAENLAYLGECTKEVDNYVTSSGTFSFCLMLWVQDLININSFSFLADVIKPNVVELVEGGIP